MKHRVRTSAQAFGPVGDGHSKLPLQVCMAWTHASGWDRVEIIHIPRGKGWESGGHAFSLKGGWGGVVYRLLFRVDWGSPMRLTSALDAIHLAAVLLLACSICTPVFAQTAIDLQLVLAVDASGSVDQRRFELRCRVMWRRSAIRVCCKRSRRAHAGDCGHHGAMDRPGSPDQVLPWTLINDATTAQAFAGAIMATPRRLFSGGTSISGVIDYAVPLMLESPFKGRVASSTFPAALQQPGRPAASARDAAVRAGIVINGLPILALEPDAVTISLIRDRRPRCLRHRGRERYETFADAIIKKLIREMASNEPRPHAGQSPQPPEALLIHLVERIDRENLRHRAGKTR